MAKELKLHYRSILLLLCFFLVKNNALRAQMAPLTDSVAIAAAMEAAWVENLYQHMSLEERLGQLIMIRAQSNWDKDKIEALDQLIQQYYVGGLCFFQGTPERQVELTNRFQQLSKNVPLLIAMDAEWGLNMRFKELVMSFPHQLTLGAIKDNSLLYEMGKEVARQCQRMGIHINFAPVADINNNPGNPVISDRSFGEDRYNVAAKCFMYMKGMQDGNVMACAKHFPGHGDTDVDSHFELPVISYDKDRLDSIELFPFRVLAQEGIQSMMVAHLSVPALDSTANTPTTLSKPTVTDLLRNDIGFDGLIITDALEMKGVTKYFGSGEVEARALAAGNDILLLPENVPAALNSLKEFIRQGLIDTLQLEKSVKKVLAAKYRLNVRDFTPISTYNLLQDLNTPYAKTLKRRLIESSLTLVRNPGNLVPFYRLDTLEMASLSIGVAKRTTFQQTLARYQPMTHMVCDKYISAEQQAALLSQFSGKDVVVVGLFDLDKRLDRNFGVTESTVQFLKALQQKTKVVLVLFGTPYALRSFDDIDWILQAYESDVVTQELAAQSLFGAFALSGILPVSASPRSYRDMGWNTAPTGRLRFDIPESVGLNSEVLDRIDYIVQEGIAKKAFPGCQVLVAKDNRVVFFRAYGKHTYESSDSTTTEDIFDMASITKIAATTLSTMKLYDEGKLDISKPMSRYLKALKGTNKDRLLIQDIMIHQAGLQAWIPFYKNTVMFDGREVCPSPAYYATLATGDYNIPVACDLYMRSDYCDSVRREIYNSPLRGTTDYKYSDLGFILLRDMIHEMTDLDLDVYPESVFYRSLGMGSTAYNPWNRFPSSLLVPTEEDHYFRMQQVNGYVHDMGAAMLGGVSGHAGLFSNANDLAIFSQLLLNKGEYGGVRYLKPETVALFTSRFGGSTRRGLGFDMKELDTNKTQTVSEKASANTFGHTGFTGNCFWIDPDNGLIYIFLSNRTYPSMNNNRLINGDYRTRIQGVIYDARI